MRFTINLATRTYLDNRLLNQVCWGVIALLVLLLGWNVTRASWNQGELRRLDDEIASLESRFNKKPGDVSEKDFVRQQAQIRFYNEIAGGRRVNWMRQLALIEEVTPDGIAMSLIAPGKDKDDVRLEGRARSFATVRRYLEKLEESEHFTNVLLQSHQELLIGETGRGVQFVISCRVRN